MQLKSETLLRRYEVLTPVNGSNSSQDVPFVQLNGNLSVSYSERQEGEFHEFVHVDHGNVDVKELNR